MVLDSGNCLCIQYQGNLFGPHYFTQLLLYQYILFYHNIAFITTTMVVLTMDANVNHLIQFITSISIDDFSQIYQALLFSQFEFQKPPPFLCCLSSKMHYSPCSLVFHNYPGCTTNCQSVHGGFPILHHQQITSCFGGCLLLPLIILIHLFQPACHIYQLLHS